METSEDFLSRAILEEGRRFHHEIVDGEDHETLVLSKACADLTVGTLQAWVASAYLAPMASASNEEAARHMFSLVRSTLLQTIEQAAWLDLESRRASTFKMSQTRLQFIGDVESKRLDNIVLRPGSFWAAFLQIAGSVNADNFAEIGHPSPAPGLYPNFGGAINSRANNAIWVSPEISRPPYLRIGSCDGVSFGAFGTLIGHELAHGVSPDGIGWDAAGLLRETWTAAARRELDTRVNCLERQLAGTKAEPDATFDAHRALDEHVADLVGVNLALAAMEVASTKTTGSNTGQDQYREFFVAYAQQECGWSDDMDVPVDDAHAPARLRINGVLSNVPKFAATFRCPQGTAMAPAQRCSVW